MDGLEFLNFLGLDIPNLVISILALVILLAIVFMLRILRLDRIYDRYKRQIDLIAEFAPDVFLRIAFDIGEGALQAALLHYEEVADQRVADGLIYIDPRMLYAIDRVEQALPEAYQIDFNIVLDRMERIYQKMKAEGAFSEWGDPQ